MAIWESDANLVQSLLESNLVLDINTNDFNEWTLLTYAIKLGKTRTGQREIVEYLLNHGVDINQRGGPLNLTAFE